MNKFVLKKHHHVIGRLQINKKRELISSYRKNESDNFFLSREKQIFKTHLLLIGLLIEQTDYKFQLKSSKKKNNFNFLEKKIVILNLMLSFLFLFLFSS